MPAQDLVTITIEGRSADYVAAIGAAQAATRALSEEIDQHNRRLERTRERTQAFEDQLEGLNPPLTRLIRRLGTLTRRLEGLNPHITSGSRRLSTFLQRLDALADKRIDLNRVLPLDPDRIEQTTRATQALCQALADKQALVEKSRPADPPVDERRLDQVRQQAERAADADLQRTLQAQAQFRHRLGIGGLVRPDFADEEKFRSREQIRVEQELTRQTQARQEALEAQNEANQQARSTDEERVALARQLEEIRTRPLVTQLRILKEIEQTEKEAIRATRKRLASQYRLGEIESGLDLQTQIDQAEQQHKNTLAFLRQHSQALSEQQQDLALQAAEQARQRDAALAQQTDRIQEQVQAEKALGQQVDQTTKDIQQADQRRAEEPPARENRFRASLRRTREATRAAYTDEELAERDAHARRIDAIVARNRQERAAERQERLDQVFREENARTQQLAEQTRTLQQQAETTQAAARAEEEKGRAVASTQAAHAQTAHTIEQQTQATQALTSAEQERTSALTQQTKELLDLEQAQRVVSATQEKRLQTLIEAEGRPSAERPDPGATPTQAFRRTRQAERTRRQLANEEQALKSLTRQRSASDRALSQSLDTQLAGLRDQLVAQDQLRQQQALAKEQEIEAAHRQRATTRRIEEAARAERVRQEADRAFAQRAKETRQAAVQATLADLNRQSQALKLTEVLAQARDQQLIEEAVRRTRQARAASQQRTQLEREAAKERAVQARLAQAAQAQAAQAAQAQAAQAAEQAYQRRLRTRLRRQGRQLFIGIAQDKEALLQQAQDQYAQQLTAHRQEEARLEQSLLRGVGQGQGSSEAADQLRERIQAVQKERRRVEREAHQVQEALTAPSPFRRFVTDLRPVPNLLASIGQRFSAMTDSIQLASTALFRFLLVVGLIKLALAAVPTALALVGGALAALGAIAAVRYNRALREANATTRLFAHELEATYRITNQFGLSLQEAATLAQSIADTLEVARTDPLSAPAEGLRQLNIDLVEFDARGQGAIDLLAELSLQIQQLDRSRQQPLLESILGDNSQAIGLVLSRQIAQARLQAPITPLLDEAGQQQITALERGYKRLTQSLYAELNQFVANQSQAMLTLLDFLAVRVPLISQTIQDTLGPSLDTFAQRIEATYLRTTRFVQGLEPTWDRIVLRMRQAAALFTQLGLSGPAVVDLAAALVALAGTMALITPLLRFTIAAFGLVRTLAPLLTTLVGAIKGSAFGPIGAGVGAAAGLAGGIAAFRFGSGLIESFEQAFEEAKSTEQLQSDLIAIQEQIATGRQQLQERIEEQHQRRTRAGASQVARIRGEIDALEEQERVLQDRLAQRQRAEEEVEAQAQALVAQEEAKAQAIRDRLAQEEAQREQGLVQQRRQAASEQRQQAEALRQRVQHEQRSVSSLVEQLHLTEAITSAYQTLIRQATTLEELSALQKAAISEGRDPLVQAARQGTEILDLNRLLQTYADAGDQAGVALIAGLLRAIQREEGAARTFLKNTVDELAERTFGQEFAERIETITQEQLRERILRRQTVGGTGDLETILDSLELRLNALAQPQLTDQITQAYQQAPALFRQLLQAQDRLHESSRRWSDLTLHTFQAFKTGLADVLLGVQSLEEGLGQLASQTLRRILNAILDEFTVNLTRRLVQATEGVTAQEGINAVLGLLNTASAGGTPAATGAVPGTILEGVTPVPSPKRIAPAAGVSLTQNIQVEGTPSPQAIEQIRQAARQGVYEAAQDPYGRALLQALTREDT